MSLPTNGGGQSGIRGADVRKHLSALAQFMNRLTRITNVVAQTHSGLQNVRHKSLIAELKPQVIDSLKDVDLIALVDATQPVIDAAESSVTDAGVSGNSKT